MLYHGGWYVYIRNLQGGDDMSYKIIDTSQIQPISNIQMIVVVALVLFGGFMGFMIGEGHQLDVQVAQTDHRMARELDQKIAEELASNPNTIPLSYNDRLRATSNAVLQCEHHQGLEFIRWIDVDAKGRLAYSGYCNDLWIVGANIL